MMRIEVSSDGFSLYLDAIAKSFRYGECDYGEVIKVYGTSNPQPSMNPKTAASRYSPGRLKSVEKHPRFGMPEDKHISTSYMEGWNLTLRMGPPLHSPHQRLLEEDRESSLHAGDHRCLLQLLPETPFSRRSDTGDGSRSHRIREDGKRQALSQTLDAGCYNRGLKLDHYRISTPTAQS